MEITQYVQEVQVNPWHHHNHRPFMLGRVERRGGALQLMVEVQISVNGSTPKSIKALIDTGAQTNLLKANVFPDEFWTNAKKPLALTTVNGETLPGGKREIKAQMTFLVDPESKKYRSDNFISQNENSTWTTDVWFYDGDISCDAILGYSWLAQKRLNVQPWRDALQLHDPPHLLLLSKPLPQKKILESANKLLMADTPCRKLPRVMTAITMIPQPPYVLLILLEAQKHLVIHLNCKNEVNLIWSGMN